MSRIVFIIIGLICLSCNQNNVERVAVLQASSDSKIFYSTNNGDDVRFEIAEQNYLNEIKVECGNNPVKFEINSELDSLIIHVNKGDTVDVFIVFDPLDSVQVRVVGIPKNVNFSDEYIANHKGKVEVVIPEVHELINIMVAISEIGQQDSNMVDMTTAYYREVMNHFLDFKDHEMMQEINRNITKVLDEKSYVYYFALKMNACGYVFDDQGNIIDDGVIHRMGFSFSEDPFLSLGELIEDFSKKSEFRKFYKEHLPYYQELISSYNELVPIRKMQDWLEDKFKISYGNYLVTFSPLVGNPNSTQKYEDNGFTQTVMYVSKAVYSDDYNNRVNEILQSNVVFTEIDHNFVNPTSDKHIDEINVAFEDRDTWVNEGPMSSIYGSPMGVFNEYMTWAVFSLYCLDNFEKEDAKTGLNELINFMEIQRGFISYGLFNQELMSIYQKNTDVTMDSLYVKILRWSYQQ